jgi:NAD(P)-dependent dehydrogenase (short-subunit alcohol dehydrogenase family)
MGRLDDKVAIITGGVSGIGKATVELFSEEGAHVVIGDIQDEKGIKYASELGATYVHADVSREADVKNLVETATKEYGRLDCIFNNAGIGGVSDLIESISVEGFDSTLDVLLKGVFLGMKHAAPWMKKQGAGSIINTSSVAGLTTGWGPHVYSTAKAAVIHLSRSVAMELGEYGVRVNCICPGAIPTPIFGRTWGLTQEESEKGLMELKKLFESAQPIKRSGLTDDIAKAALWLASDDSTFVTGQALVVDGGITLGNTWSEYVEKFKVIRTTIMGKT